MVFGELLSWFSKKFNLLEQAKKELPNLAFVTEDLLAQGYEVITLNSPDYSKTLKNNLKIKDSPTILYVKGNKQMMQETSIAIVGSRDADQVSLDFTDNLGLLHHHVNIQQTYIRIHF